MFERILVPVDGSGGALAALEHAVELQGKFDSDLPLLCVYRHYSLLEASMSMVRPEDPENLDDAMRASGYPDRSDPVAGLSPPGWERDRRARLSARVPW